MDQASQLSRLLIDLFKSQRLAALSTQSNGQPYGCLVAFASTDDLRGLLFVTDRGTRKYRELSVAPRVAMLIDSRSNQEVDFGQAVAVTAIGQAAEVAEAERGALTSAYLVKHPNLADFLEVPNNALIKVEVETYIISSFRETATLQP